jgi:hypothetical protein
MKYNTQRCVCYSMQSEGYKGWYAAQTYCKETYPGGHLLYITTPEELAMVEIDYGKTYM